MGTIKPSFTLTANSSSATTPGPLSIALSLSATDSVDVNQATSKIETVTDTHEVLWAHADFEGDGTNAMGVDGGFVYVKNVHASNKIAIGHGAAGDMNANNAALRMMTLLPGEFAWFPWDFTSDLIADADGTATRGLETWVFTRTGSGE